MTDIVPISTDVFNIPKQLLNHLDIVAGLDCGVCLTKIVYVPKKLVNYDDESNTIILATALFDSKDVLDAIEFLKNEACLPETGVLHVTGTIGTSIKKTIHEKMGLDVFYVDEVESHFKGTQFLLDSLSLQEITFPPVEAKSYGIIEHQLYAPASKKEDDNNTNSTLHWPAVYVNIGSRTTIGLIESNGKYSLLCGSYPGGKYFLGLAQLILGTSDYKEVLSLAESGDRCKVDTQMKDVLKITDDPKSNYGKVPPEMPIFAFGKAADTGSNEINYAKEDIAASLVASVCFAISTSMQVINSWIKNSKIFFSGSVLFSSQFRVEMEYSGRRQKRTLNCDHIYLKTSHTAAIGAMLTSE